MYTNEIDLIQKLDSTGSEYKILTLANIFVANILYDFVFF